VSARACTPRFPFAPHSLPIHVTVAAACRYAYTAALGLLAQTMGQGADGDAVAEDAVFQWVHSKTGGTKNRLLNRIPEGATLVDVGVASADDDGADLMVEVAL
jgi:hypothetical protein